MNKACSRHGVPLAALALQFPLRHPAIAAIVVGARTPDAVAVDLELPHVSIPPELWGDPEIARLGRPTS